ncbi:hypothetical protein FPCIR_10313 [Fusarium pseudocircinatum]|uniref:Uncharacterized protein n=1 Tax=Fusarium pseudocircinatum TaxID=56676 RepID=A0A8H5NY28_9HYPO|nr:hypothetical protein FPCIR_10313 [Fusarium pseudocircinatum]
MTSEPDDSDSAAPKGNGRSPASHAFYCIFNNVRQCCRPPSKPEIEGPYFATIGLEPRLLEDFRPLLDQIFRRYDYNVSDGIITTRVGPKNHDDYATGKIRLRDPRAKKPGLIFLVGYSQTEDALKKIAKDYIVKTKGAVTTVVCFDIKGHQDPSSVSLWRARQKPESETVEAVCSMEPAVFQDSDGEHVIRDDKSFELRLSDILMETNSDECPLPSLHLHQLSFFLQMAKA